MTRPSIRDTIHFVLVRAQFASNLGTAVRSLKNMGFENLVLVEPECEVGVEARARAMRGASILDRARYLPSLESVQKEIGVLAATTGRFQTGTQTPTTCRGFAQELLPTLIDFPIGLVFGPEDNGLRRSELDLCQYQITIPSGSDFPVMNLSQAVAIVAYEMHLAFTSSAADSATRRASSEDVTTLLRRLRGFLEPRPALKGLSIERIMRKVHAMSARAQLDADDLRLIHTLIERFENERT